jgi:hypothetical protein
MRRWRDNDEVRLMAIRASTRAKDLGGNRIFREIAQLNGQSIKVGIQSDAGDEADGTPIVMVGMWNELGTAHIPSRPFMRTAADNNRGSLWRVASIAYDQILTGGTANTALHMVGQWYEALQKRVIRDGDWVGNSLRTIVAKGSWTPLIDTSRMINSIRYIIIRGRS